MNSLNAALTSITDAFFSAFASWPPALVLIIVSALLGVVMAVAFRFTSQQKKLKRVAELTRAQVLAIKLFKDDLHTMFTSLGRLFKYTGLRLWHSLPPMLVMVIPFTLLLVQIARWYEYQPLAPEDRVVLEMEIAEGAWESIDDLKLSTSAGITATKRHREKRPPRLTAEEQERLRKGFEIPALDEIEKYIVSWELQVDANPTADDSVFWKWGDLEGTKRIAAAPTPLTLCAVDQQRAGADWIDQILFPGEPAFASETHIKNVTVHFEPRETPVLGLNVPWWLTLLVVSIVTALLVRPLVGVQF